MSRCFICCRPAKPDQELAGLLKKNLEEKDHSCFLDTRIMIGTEWVKEIEKQIKSSDFFILLVSNESILSDMVRQEVKLAFQLWKKRRERFKILPVRVDFPGKLPYDLGAYLDRFQHFTRVPEEDFKITAARVLSAVETPGGLTLKVDSQDFHELGETVLSLEDLFTATEEIGAPLPAADPRLVPHLEPGAGTIKWDSPFYVKRQADRDIMAHLQKNGATIIVKGPRQMGKSSLLIRTLADSQKIHRQCCYLDFKYLEQTQLTDLDSLCQYLARKIYRTVNNTTPPEETWDKNLPAKDNFTQFIKDSVLKKNQSPVVILLDEVDRLFNQPYRDEFFATLRAWHNLRAVEEVWKYLSLLITHSSEPYFWLQDINQSPFNVGNPIKLEDFDFEQVKELNIKHGNPLADDEDIHELIHLTGGQPYLVRKALYRMVKDQYNIMQLNRSATEDFGPFGDHLRQLLWRLHGQEGLSESLRQVLRNGQCDYEPHFFRLRSAGFIKGENRDSVKIRCQLYEDYFWKHL